MRPEGAVGPPLRRASQGEVARDVVLAPICQRLGFLNAVGRRGGGGGGVGAEGEGRMGVGWRRGRGDRAEAEGRRDARDMEGWTTTTVITIWYGTHELGHGARR